MAWYNPFSWGEKAQDNILDKNDGLLAKVGDWIGNLKLTKEEVMEFNGKTMESVREFVKSTLSENTERSITRRRVAVLWIKVELALILCAAIAGPWNMELAKFYLEIASTGVMFGGTVAIIIFFFGSYGLARLKETPKK